MKIQHFKDQVGTTFQQGFTVGIRRSLVSHKYSFLATIILAISILLAGCLDMAGDMTPPPGQTSSMEQAAAAPPQSPHSENVVTEENAPEQSPTEESLGSVVVEVFPAPEEDLPTNLEVSLFGYDHMALAYEVALPVSDSDDVIYGKVTFDDVPFIDGYMYLAELTYRGVTYRSAIIEASTSEPSLNLQIDILGTTTDTSSLVVDRMHIFLDLSRPEVIGMGEIFVVSNMGDQTVIAKEDGGHVLSFALPSEAANIQFQDGQLGGRYKETEDGFADTASIMPGHGVHQIMVYFDLPYPQKQLEITQTINYLTGATVVLLTEGSANIDSPQLQDQGSQETETGMIHVYSGDVMTPGSTFTFTVSDPSAKQVISQNLLIGLGALVVALVAAGVWFFLRSRGDKKLAPYTTTPVALPGDADDILDTIIALDDLFENGEIDTKIYQQRRGELKAQLGKTVEKG